MLGNHVNDLVVSEPTALGKLEDRLVEATVEDALHLPGMATLRFRDPKCDLLDDAGVGVGDRVELQVRGSQTVRLFVGTVASLETDFDGTGTYTTVRAYDDSALLMRGRRVTTYTNMKASDIAKQLATAAGLTKQQVDPTSRVYRSISQPNLSDWDFLRALATENGFQMGMVDGTFKFCQPADASTGPAAGTTALRNDLVVEMNQNIVAMRATSTSVAMPAKVQVRGWDFATKRQITAQANVTPAASRQIKIDKPPTKKAGGKGAAAQLLVADVPYGNELEAQAVAAAVAEDVASAATEIEVVIRGNPKVLAGVAIRLAGVGKTFEGRYTVSSSRHIFGPDVFYETTLTVAGRADRSAYGLVSGAAGGGAQLARAHLPRVPGLAIGLVTNVRMPAGVPGGTPNHGWVKLSFPWLADAADYESDWVRTVQLAGVTGGGMFSPQIGDEVLVGFEQGLLDRPYVLGGLYNGVDAPSAHGEPLVETGSGKTQRWSLASRDGNRIELLDLAGANAGVRVRTGGSETVVYLHRSTGAVEVTGKTISLTATGDIEINGKNVKIDASSNVTVKGAQIRLN